MQKPSASSSFRLLRLLAQVTEAKPKAKGKAKPKAKGGGPKSKAKAKAKSSLSSENGVIDLSIPVEDDTPAPAVSIPDFTKPAAKKEAKKKNARDSGPRGPPEEEFRKAVDFQARRLVLPYLRAFDEWGRWSFSGLQQETDNWRKAVKVLLDSEGEEEAFLLERDRLAKIREEAPDFVPSPSEYGGGPGLWDFYEEWGAVLTNLDLLHKRTFKRFPNYGPVIPAAWAEKLEELRWSDSDEDWSAYTLAEFKWFYGEGNWEEAWKKAQKAPLSAAHKRNSVSFGIKYKLYAIRNSPALRGLRPYWTSNLPKGPNGAEEEEISDADWASLEGAGGMAQTGRGQLALKPGVTHFEEERWQWSLYVPESYEEGQSYPLIIGMHGATGRGDDFLLSWLTPARKNRCFVISPKSLGPTWGSPTWNDDPSADAQNILTMIKTVKSAFPGVDLRRIFCTGMSDGGSFSYALAAYMPQLFAGVAPAGAFPVPVTMGTGHPIGDNMPQTMLGVPHHHVHGTFDFLFDIKEVREADKMVKETPGLAATWKMTELPDWTHSSPQRVHEEQIMPWFASLPPNARFDGDFKSILQDYVPWAVEKEGEQK